MRRVFTALLVVLAVTGVVAQEGCNQVVSEGIKAGNAQFSAALAARNASGLAAVYRSDATLMPANSPDIKSSTGIQAFWQGVINNGIARVELDTEDIYTLERDDICNYALERGQYTMYTANGNIVDQGRYLVLWQSTEGMWGNTYRILWDMFSSYSPASSDSAKSDRIKSLIKSTTSKTFAPFPQPTLCSYDAWNGIVYTEDQFSSAFAAHNASGIAALYDNGAILMPPNWPDITMSGIQSFWQGVINSGIASVTLNPIISPGYIASGCPSAIELGQYTTYTASGAVADQGRYIAVWDMYPNVNDDFIKWNMFSSFNKASSRATKVEKQLKRMSKKKMSHAKRHA